MEIKDVFSAQARSVWEYLCENGQGLYIPAYQRQYSWDSSKIKRLIEDMCHGFLMLLNQEDSITFLGTIIAIHDTNYLTVNPLVKGDVPSRVMTIIDGQQRLTTLLLINTVLHHEIGLRLNKIKDLSKRENEWLHEECIKVMANLNKTFEENMAYGDGDFQYYPRMIRAYEDSWSRKERYVKYSSPIGKYLHQYGSFIRSKDKKDFVKNYLEDLLITDKSKYKPLFDGRQIILKQIKEIIKDIKPENLDLPNYNEIISKSKFQNILLKSDFPDEVKTSLRQEGNKDYKELLYLILFTNFVLDRVAITVVTAKNEDYAFDMFESLNTTGEPLTAFETFKPKVIYVEGLEDYENSEARKNLTTIEEYLEEYNTKSADKQDITSRLIVSFALAETGEKLSKRLSDQRKFLKEKYEKLTEIDEKNKFVRHFADVTLFIKNSWPDEKTKQPTVYDIDNEDIEEVKLCLDVLRSFKHTITIGPLSRFYSNIRQANHEYRQKASRNFIEAVKATTAFSILWRASRRTTDNIDGHYRKLMEDGNPNINFAPLARAKGNIEELLDIRLYKDSLINILNEEGKILNKEDWVKAAVKIPAYKNQKDITRFILLAAAHDSIIDPNNPGLTIKGKEGTLPLLTHKFWLKDDIQTIEHIAPQTSNDGWNNKLYEDPDTIEKLGNLTLLPCSENSCLGNGSWKKKRLVYEILSSENADTLKGLIIKAKSLDIDISQQTEEILKCSKYLPMVKALSEYQEEWSVDIIEKRSRRIAELAWDRIWPWLTN